MKKLLLIGIVVLAWYFGGGESSLDPAPNNDSAGAPSNVDNALLSAFRKQQSNVQVHSQGHVVKLLPDDNQGSRHQRFIVEIASGHTVLIAHNIDLASRVASLKAGDQIEFNGEYEWNPQGGVVHWTHHDPENQHRPAWIKRNGHTYQ
ncbi:MAG: DUF3465 domain-containing protein [Gammaproteobacteria bacterium]|nr:DUF3465 domain-containing protein [Gammaproteobacteria bacterium]